MGVLTLEQVVLGIQAGMLKGQHQGPTSRFPSNSVLRPFLVREALMEVKFQGSFRVQSKLPGTSPRRQLLETEHLIESSTLVEVGTDQKNGLELRSSRPAFGFPRNGFSYQGHFIQI